MGRSCNTGNFLILRTTATKLYSNEGLCQVLFFESDEECETSYKDKKGKYQNQTGITLPKIK